MAKLTCDNLSRNTSLFRALVRSGVNLKIVPPPEDFNLAESWFDQLSQEDLEKGEELDPASDFLVFAAKERGDLGELDMLRLLTAQKSFLTSRFVQALQECNS